MLLSVGGSWVLRDDRSDEHNVKADRVVRNYAGRLDLSKGIFSLGGEYVAKSRSVYWDDAYNIRYGKGRNVLLYAGIDAPGIGFSATFRAFENGDLRVDDCLNDESVSLNYVPALTMQHKYALLTYFRMR